MSFKTLSIKGTILEKNQIEKYLEKVAASHVLQENSNAITYPIPNLKSNYNYIMQTYNLLNEHVKLNINIHPAGEWILDNFYIIEETVKRITKELTKRKYTNLIGIQKGPYKGFARIYVLASEIVAYTDSKIEEENLENLIKSYQNKKTLTMEEMWYLPIFMQIAIIQNIKEIAEKIYEMQLQKYKVESIVERLVENKNLKEQKFNLRVNTSKDISYKEMKYPFIEYMSYKLKKHGKDGYSYLKILEEQVNMMGTSIDDVIKKEHFLVALLTVTMQNAILSIKEINRINFQNIFEKINGVEEILKKDPMHIYDKMDFKTKAYYRDKIKKISDKSKISELYIAKKVIELADRDFDDIKELQDKKRHVGYYLIDEGLKELLGVLNINIKYINNDKKAKRYIYAFFFFAVILSLLFSSYIYTDTRNIVYSIIFLIVSIIPLSEIYIQVCNCILNKIVSKKLIPKLDFMGGIPKEYSSMVIVPTIIKNKEKVKELAQKLEVYYLANKSDNLYFTILGDCSNGKNEIEDFDQEVIEEGIKQIDILNKKYPNEEFNIFNFFYRKRTWSSSEDCYLGWERKRGLITQLNNFLVDGINDFKYNSMKDLTTLPEIKYIITLDSDTNLILDSGLELIGAMAHVLNIPVLNKEENLVVGGHALIQPRVGIDLLSSRKSLFTQIYAGTGGTDTYANAISDVYQDNFEEGIFTGKGIYDLKVFHTIFKKEIPENIVLSHDLLEGSYLRAGLSTDILLMDGYPTKYNSYVTRAHRWTRGDWQIIGWLKNNIKDINGNMHKNPLTKLSKFKIFDNLRRSLVPIFTILLFIFSFFTRNNSFITLALITSFIPFILDLLNFIIFRKDNIQKQKSYVKNISGLQASFIRTLLDFMFLPDRAYTFLDAIIRTLSRLKKKKRLLEWTTAEDAEKNAKSDVMSYYRKMYVNIIFGILAIIFGKMNILLYVIVIMWTIAPFIAYKISIENTNKSPVTTLNEKDKEFVLEIAKRTWDFFKDYLTKENNYLPPDNYQEDRAIKVVNRTSSTNIGLGLLSVVSAFDLGFIDKNKAIELLQNMIDTIQKLSKWNGHLYNWYNITTLEPLMPRYISTVDSGNFVGYLYVLKEFLEEINDSDNISNLITIITTIINNTDFSHLYSQKHRLFSIGYNIEEGKLTDSYYDFLASEARQASLIAIAKKDVAQKHWNNLNRTLTIQNRYKGLISWSGTAFEYLMPNVNIKKYPGSLLDESCKFMIMSQKEYCKRLGIPWGISESAFNTKDFNNNYQYKAFGLPWLGLKRGLLNDMVVAPYGSILAIQDVPKDVIQNLRNLEKQNMFDKYGFYESIDYTPSRLKLGQKYEAVKTYMAHHQGLILLSINNLMNNNILQNRFSKNPEIQAVDILLQERMPKKVIITKEKKEKIEKLKYVDYEDYSQRVITKTTPYLNKLNVISNENYKVMLTDKLTGYSQYKDIMINRYKSTSDEHQGIMFYVKDVKQKRIWSSAINESLGLPDKFTIYFNQDENKIKRVDGNIESTTRITVTSDEPVEIRSIELNNTGLEEQLLEVTTAIEPVLSNKFQDYSHMAFNNLFLKFEYDFENEILFVKRKSRVKGRTEPILGVCLYTESDTIGEVEYEIDKEKFMGRGNIGIPVLVKESKPFSKTIGLVTDPIMAFRRTLKINPKEKAVLSLIICVGEDRQDITKTINKYKNNENIQNAFELSRARTEAENRYLGIKANQIELYQNMLSYILLQSPMKSIYLNTLPDNNYLQSSLWKYGISGDLPIILFKIKDINEIYVLQEMLKAYEFYKVKNIKVDLVILNSEENIYEQYVKDAIENEILNNHLGYLKNVSGGIFVINTNQISKQDKDLLNFVATLNIDSSLGDLKTILKDMEQEYLDSIKNIGINEGIGKIEQENSIKSTQEAINNLKDIKYYNEYGGFSEDGKEYLIKINKSNKTPTVWSHIIANEKFGSVLTESMGGYTWNKNSRLNRLSAWNNNQVQDIPSEIIYLKDLDTKKTWSLGCNPNADENDYYITYGFGYAKYNHTSSGIIQEANVFVAKDDSAKVNIIRLKNTNNVQKNIKLIYYIKPVLGEDEIKTTGYIKLDKRNSKLICAKNMYNNELGGISYISCSEKINSFTGNKNFFIGKGTVKVPESLEKVSLDNSSGLGHDSCIAIELILKLDAYENKEICITFGQEETLLDAENIGYKYSDLQKCKQEQKSVKEFWQQKLNKLQVKTPIESLNIMLNGWSVYQTIVCRLWARSGYYQSGGAIGFRDQLQDSMGIKYINEKYMKKQIIKSSAHQFIQGDVEHWWHDETGKGIRTRFSDDFLWLVYVTCEYISFTGDYSILDEETNYLLGEELKNGEDERYDYYPSSEEKSDIYTHLVRAIEKALNFGENGLPKIGSGDWNDGFSTVGNKGRGESVWLGFFIYDILNKFIPICQMRNDTKRVEKYTDIKEQLKRALNTNAWDGRWYKRAYMDDGSWLRKH